jgi:hypothetical protein
LPLLRFLLAWLLFTAGPGALAAAWLTRELDPLRRAIVFLAVGTALLPLVVVALGLVHALGAFPVAAALLALAGAAAAYATSPSPRPRTSREDWWAAGVIVAVAAATGAIAFAHRLSVGAGGIAVYGFYDSMDLSYYAVMAAESTHTVPPAASFYSGHMLNAAYYPQLVFAMVRRFAGVPLLTMYFRYAWPACLCLGALTMYVYVRSLARSAVACLAVLLTLVAADFSYLAAWLLPHATFEWDYLLWSTNFLSPTVEVLHFNTWTPTLPVFFGTLYGVTRALQARSIGWIVLSAAMLAVLFQFKPFAFMVVAAGLAPAALFAWRMADGRRLAATLVLAAVFTLPFVYAIATQQDRRSRFLIDPFLLPRRMLLKLNLEAWLDSAVAPAAPVLRHPLVLIAATILFFAGGLGVRWLGLPGVWRAVRRRMPEDATAWSVAGWCAAAGILIPFVLTTDPYVDTLQFYQAGLYLLWIFTAAALLRIRVPALRAAAVAASILVSLPTTVHFLSLKWTDDRREPRVSISRGEVAIANTLHGTDPEQTVVLHDHPESPSLIAILAERRVVLGWGHPYYAVGSAGRLNDVNAFFSSADGSPTAAFDLLRRYHVTHVIVTSADHVNAAVLSRLTPINRFPDVTLYEVPSGL